ncbi:MAG: HPr family phosphocarrier protein [Cellulomonas sp.]|nr:HPr family phosphocarrier protein [Cellulomonas sp.]
MPTRVATIGSQSGLHARPAALFTQAAAAAGHEVSIGRDGGPAVPAASVLMVMSLGLKQGDRVVLSAPDDAADGALDELAALLARDLDAQ